MPSKESVSRDDYQSLRQRCVSCLISFPNYGTHHPSPIAVNLIGGSNSTINSPTAIDFDRSHFALDWNLQVTWPSTSSKKSSGIYLSVWLFGVAGTTCKKELGAINYNAVSELVTRFDIVSAYLPKLLTLQELLTCSWCLERPWLMIWRNREKEKTKNGI